MPENIELASVIDKVIGVAQAELLPRFAQVQGQCKMDGSLVTEADLETQHQLANLLHKEWPQFLLLSEEQTAAQQQHALDHIETGIWCLDPLDGTSNFIAGVPYYALSLALIVKSEIVLSVVYDPSRDECFSAERGKGSYLNGRPLPIPCSEPPLSQSLALVDFKRLPEKLLQPLIQQPPYKSQRSFGAVALDWCWLAANRVQVYLHGSQNIWDYVAGHFIHTETGGQASTLAGDPVFLPELAKRSALASRHSSTYTEWKDWIDLQTGK